jgi:hypothetical protein
VKFVATDCIIAVGRRGCGKSHLGRLIQQVWPRRVIFDPMDEYDDDKKKFPHRITVRSFHDFTDQLAELEKTQPKSFEIVVKMDINQDEDIQEIEFDQSLKLLFDFQDVFIVTEEIQLFSTSHSRGISKWLKNCLLVGRHRGIGMLFTSQRPAEVHKTIFGLCNHVFCGVTSEGNDLRYLANMFGDEIKKLPTLQKRRFLYYGPDGISEISTEGKNPVPAKLAKS